MTREEWEKRFKARIVERLLTPLTKEQEKEVYLGDPDWEPWTKEAAENCAQAEFEAVEFEFLYKDYEEDPEGSADESLSNWSD